MCNGKHYPEGPSTLVAILVAARRAGDRELERETRTKLRDRFGIKLRFASEIVDRNEVTHD